MKIGFVLDDTLDKPDGVQQYILALGDWFAEQGHQIHYLVANTNRVDIKNVHSLARLIGLPFNGNRVRTPLPASRKAVRLLLNKESFDVLHVQLPYSPWFAGRVIKAAPDQTAIVGTFHILPYSNMSRLAAQSLKLFRHQLKRFSEVLSVSQPAQAFALESLGVNSKVVPNTVNIKRFKITSPKHDMFTIIFLGRLVERKGCQFLLKAAAQLGDLKFKIIVGGDGPLRSELKHFVHKNNLHNKVEFLGFIDEAVKPNLLADADLAVFPSTSGESFGIVLLEAMANGQTVVLAGNNPGYSSVLSRRQQLFDPNNTKTLAEIIKRYALDITARKQAIDWQNRHVQQYDIKNVGNEIELVYREALQSTKTMR